MLCGIDTTVLEKQGRSKLDRDKHASSLQDFEMQIYSGNHVCSVIAECDALLLRMSSILSIKGVVASMELRVDEMWDCLYEERMIKVLFIAARY